MALVFKIQDPLYTIMSVMHTVDTITCLPVRPGSLDEHPPLGGHHPHGEAPLLLLRRRHHAGKQFNKREM